MNYERFLIRVSGGWWWLETSCGGATHLSASLTCSLGRLVAYQGPGFGQWQKEQRVIYPFLLIHVDANGNARVILSISKVFIEMWGAQNTHSACRDGVRKAWDQLELQLERDVEDSRKGYMGSKRPGFLLNEHVKGWGNWILDATLL